MLLQRAILAGMLAFPGLAQESAKSLFRDATSGVVIQTAGKTQNGGKRASTSPAPKRTQKGPAVQPVSQVSLPAVTGLMYWIELRTETGQLLRVNANRTFKTGERIRLHVTSNVDGALTIMQSQNNGPIQMLFPPRAGVDNRVRKYEEKVFPSETGFFRFDSQSGNLRVLLMVKAEEGPAEPLLASQPPPQAPRKTSPRPQPPPEREAVPPRNTRPGTGAGAPVEIASAKRPGADFKFPSEAEMLAALEGNAGSKALEIDDSPTEAATYVVVDMRKNPNAQPGVVAVEVNLTQAGK